MTELISVAHAFTVEFGTLPWSRANGFLSKLAKGGGAGVVLD